MGCILPRFIASRGPHHWTISRRRKIDGTILYVRYFDEQRGCIAVIVNGACIAGDCENLGATDRPATAPAPSPTVCGMLHLAQGNSFATSAIEKDYIVVKVELRGERWSTRGSGASAPSASGDLDERGRISMVPSPGVFS